MLLSASGRALLLIYLAISVIWASPLAHALCARGAAVTPEHVAHHEPSAGLELADLRDHHLGPDTTESPFVPPLMLFAVGPTPQALQGAAGLLFSGPPSVTVPAPRAGNAPTALMRFDLVDQHVPSTLAIPPDEPPPEPV